MLAEGHVQDQLPAYALDCLDEGEMLAVSQHLSGCPRCQAELRAYQAVADALPLAEIHGSAGLPCHEVKARLLAQVASTPLPQKSLPSGFWQRLATALRPAPAWGWAALMLVVGLVVGGLFFQRQAPTNMAARDDAMRVVDLQAAGSSPQASALLVISLDGEHGTLVVDRLPPLPVDQQYQLWLIEGEQRTSGGVFSVSEEGYGALWVDSPQALADYDGVGITIEPAGGSHYPTGERVLGGEL